MSRLDDVLRGQEDNYILPLYWQRGEEESVIRTEMEKIDAAGIGGVIVEARPHPDYIGERWWKDMDVIMDEARARGMKVWVFDDDHFPTGRAVGRVESAPQELKRLFLREAHMDAIGPAPDASFMVDNWFINPRRGEMSTEGITLVAAVAARRDAQGMRLTGEFINVTDKVQDGVLYWDVPEGRWRVFLLFLTPRGGAAQRVNYLNPIVPESTRILIDTVYEAHYQHYADDFGKTFAGFFSDEPGFYNDSEMFNYHSKLGNKGLDLLWCDGLMDELNSAFGKDCTNYLPLLWFEGDEHTSAIRHAYMDVVSKRYGEHFTTQIGDWCRAHGVEYIGHVLEDNGVHARLGCGPGHFFRSMWGQDMSGLDIVLWQLFAGFDQGPYAAAAGDADGEFFHYGLGKLGSSLAHIDPKKKGRAMCELYGAFGWREGLRMMKWMTDHLLARGVNVMVPHAFSQAPFPDFDCPPHFYARGMNPQYRYYRILNQYINRASHLLSGGVHVASAAVLYHAEAEWAGAYMPFETPMRVLMQDQIDADVIPADVLLDGAAVVEGQLRIVKESYGCLVVPESEMLPAKVIERLLVMAQDGLELVFLNRLPERASDVCDASKALSALANLPNVQAVGLEELADVLRGMSCFEVSTEGEVPFLRNFHIRHDDLEVYFFVNEHPYQDVDTMVSIPAGKSICAYDALTPKVTALNAVEEDERYSFQLKLTPYQSLIVLVGEDFSALEMDESPTDWGGSKTQPLNGAWTVSTATAQEYPNFTAWKSIDRLFDLSRPEALPRFSGTLRYETSFDCGADGGVAMLDLGAVYEVAQVWVNGEDAGTRICPPYTFDLSGVLREGANTLVVEVTNTLVKDQRDFLSRPAQMEPTGLLGPVVLRTK